MSTITPDLLELALSRMEKALAIIDTRDLRAGFKAAKAQPTSSESQTDAWQPACIETPKGLHSNMDANAWADFWAAQFPGQAHMRDLMFTWFANAIMAGYDAATSGASQPIVLTQGDGRYDDDIERLIAEHPTDLISVSSVEPVQPDRTPEEQVHYLSGKIDGKMEAHYLEAAQSVVSPAVELPVVAWLDSQEFYELMQAYRWSGGAPSYSQQEAVDAFEAVKAAIAAQGAKK
jgi:hypothetical protein